MDKFVNSGGSRIKIMNPKSYEKKLQEEEKQRKIEIHNRRIVSIKRKTVKGALIGAAAIVALGAIVNIDFESWKKKKYKQAGYNEVARPDGITWVGTGLDPEDLSFGVYFDERMEELGIGKGK